jgi:hypothetical protein
MWVDVPIYCTVVQPEQTTTMDTTNPTFSDLKAQAPATRGAERSDQAASSIHYSGAKDPRIPMPYVIAGIVVLAGAAYALRNLVHF